MKKERGICLLVFLCGHFLFTAADSLCSAHPDCLVLMCVGRQECIDSNGGSLSASECCPTPFGNFLNCCSTTDTAPDIPNPTPLTPTKAPVTPNPTKAPFVPTQAPVTSNPTSAPVTSTLSPVPTPMTVTRTPSPVTSSPTPTTVAPTPAPVTSNPTSASVLETNSTSEENVWVTAHNKVRSQYHKAFNATFVPVQWDENLAQDAQKYANDLNLTYTSIGTTDSDTCFRNFMTQGSDEKRYGGENLFASFGDPQTADEVLESWTDEDEASKAANTFTQVIWRATKWIGCGMTSQNGCNYYVCHYVAPGNCNVNSTNAIEKAMADTSPCEPLLP